MLVKNMPGFQVLDAKFITRFAITQDPSHPRRGSNSKNDVNVMWALRGGVHFDWFSRVLLDSDGHVIHVTCDIWLLWDKYWNKDNGMTVGFNVSDVHYHYHYHRW